MKYLLALLISGVSCLSVGAQTKKSTSPQKNINSKPKTSNTMIKNTRVKIETDSGIIIVKLYNETPLHKANFIKLVKEHFYDSLLFHRVIPEFMIQGGDPLSKNAAAGEVLGNGGGDLTRIPAEFNLNLFHKRGALAGARDNNPEKASSACQFYIVQGKKYTDAELTQMEQRMGMKFTKESKRIYQTEGGTPWLDMNYTVFGEVEQGMQLIDKIAMVPKDGNNRPLTDIRIKKMEIVE